MSVLEKFKHTLKEENIIKKTNEQYAIRDFKDAAELLDSISDAIKENFDETMEIVTGYLESNADSLYFIYLQASLYYRFSQYNDKLSLKLLNLASSVSKKNIMVYLAKEILQFYESSYALNILVREYEKEGLIDDLINTWQHILKLDHNNVMLIQKIANAYDKQGKTQEAIHYYKMGLLKSYANNDAIELVNIWKKLTLLNPDDANFYLSQGKKIVGKLTPEQKRNLYKNIVNYYSKNKDTHPQEFIEILKSIISNKIFQEDLHQIIVKTYREIYKGHSYLEEFLNLSGLIKIGSNLIRGIEIFESHIKFDIDAFVQHKTFGIGVIRSIEKFEGKKIDAIQKTKIIIDFEKNYSHTMTLRIAFSSLQTLPPEHLIALHYFNKETCTALLNGDIKLLSQAILHTINAPANLKTITNLLVPKLVSQDKWMSLSKQLKIAYEDTSLYEHKNKMYYFREHTESLESETLKTFNKCQAHTDKFRTIEFYFAQVDKGDEQTILFFHDYLKKIIEQHPQEACDVTRQVTLQDNFPCIHFNALLFYQHIKKSYAVKNFDLDFVNFFSQFTANINENHVVKIANHLLLNSLKALFINTVYKHKKKLYNNSIETLLLTEKTIKKDVYLHHVISKKEKTLLQKIFDTVNQAHIKHAPTFILIAKAILTEQAAKNLIVITQEENGKLFLKLIELTAIFHKNISLDKEVDVNKPLFLTAHKLLFENDLLFDYIKKSKITLLTTANALLHELKKLTFLENYLKVEIRGIDTQSG